MSVHDRINRRAGERLTTAQGRHRIGPVTGYTTPTPLGPQSATQDARRTTK